MRKLWLFLFIAGLGSLGAQVPNFPFDPAAEPDLSLNRTELFGYRVMFFDGTDMVYFRPVNDYSQNLAQYHWKYQYWVYRQAGFQPVNLDLKRLFKKIDLTKTTLDRTYASAMAAAQPGSTSTGTTSPNPVNAPGTTTSATSTGTANTTAAPVTVNYAYDPGSVANRGLHQTVKWGYLLDFGSTADNPYVLFRDPQKPVITHATYHHQRQFWVYQAQGFDGSKIDLKALYTQIDLTKTQLDRPEPPGESILADIGLEKAPYAVKTDQDFWDFVAWMKTRKIPSETQDFYLMAANNPGKRGKLLAYNPQYTDRQVGIQSEHLKTPAYKNIENGSQVPVSALMTAGGMQYFFELRKQNYFRTVDQNMNLFRESKTVPLTLAVLDRNDSVKPLVVGPSGEILRRKVQDYLSKTFGKPFLVTLQTLKVPYSELEAQAPCSLHELGLFMDKYVHSQLPSKTLVLYYFNDLTGLKKIDDQLSHPLSRGAYGGDWDKKAQTIAHELGHGLGLRHHFDNEQQGSGDLRRHISPSCLMNYAFSQAQTCELCRYALGQ